MDGWSWGRHHPFTVTKIQGFSGVLQDGQNADGFSVKVTADESQLMILMEEKKNGKDPWVEMKGN